MWWADEQRAGTSKQTDESRQRSGGAGRAARAALSATCVGRAGGAVRRSDHRGCGGRRQAATTQATRGGRRTETPTASAGGNRRAPLDEEAALRRERVAADQAQAQEGAAGQERRVFGVDDIAEGEGEEQEEQEDVDDHFVITAARNDEETREGTRVLLGTVTAAVTLKVFEMLYVAQSLTYVRKPQFQQTIIFSSVLVV